MDDGFGIRMFGNGDDQRRRSGAGREEKMTNP
jgi:hypothetical protein